RPRTSATRSWPVSRSCWAAPSRWWGPAGPSSRPCRSCATSPSTRVRTTTTTWWGSSTTRRPEVAPGRGPGTRSLLVNVAALLGRRGGQRAGGTTAAFPDLRLSSAWVAPDTEVDVDLVLEAVLGGRLTVTGTVSAAWSGECRRCLGPVEDRLVAEVREV